VFVLPKGGCFRIPEEAEATPWLGSGEGHQATPGFRELIPRDKLTLETEDKCIQLVTGSDLLDPCA
jgi:hypothetical protein